MIPKKKNLKIALYGGAFNPVTNAHIQVSLFLLNSLNMDEVWILPCCDHRFKSNLKPFQKRLDWCHKVFDSNSRIFNFPIKIENMDQFGDGKTLHLVEEIKNKFASCDYQFYWTIGQDNADQIKTWYRWETLLKTLPFIVFPRGVGDRENKIAQLNQVEKKWYRQSPHYFVKEWKSWDISSTKVREDIKKGHFQQMRDYVPLAIIENVVKEFQCL